MKKSKLIVAAFVVSLSFISVSSHASTKAHQHTDIPRRFFFTFIYSGKCYGSRKATT